MSIHRPSSYRYPIMMGHSKMSQFLIMIWQLHFHAILIFIMFYLKKILEYFQCTRNTNIFPHSSYLKKLIVTYQLSVKVSRKWKYIGMLKHLLKFLWEPCLLKGETGRNLIRYRIALSLSFFLSLYYSLQILFHNLYWT